MSINKSDVLVLVPALNEEESVRPVLESLKQHGYSVLLISDGSTDRTAEIGRESGVLVLELPINLGVGGALRAGFLYAQRHSYLAVVQVDADGQHPVNEISHLIDAANVSDAHMVIGSRFAGGASRMQVGHVRRLAMWVLGRSATAAANTLVTDSTSGFRLIREPLLGQFAQQFANNYLGDTYESIVSAGRAGFRILEIPASLDERRHGVSTASLSSAVMFTLKGLGVWILRFHKPLERERG